ncbi:MAG TPA: DMT family transporter [Steroidobacteraceae bacterium]|nr:DMT family transporter [Steroidobacteraceae bacterium]
MTQVSHRDTHALIAWTQMHFSVVLFGFTGILGKLITLHTAPLVWWRVLIVVACLLLLPQTWRGLRQLTPRLLFTYLGIGVVLCLHWLCFYGSVKFANASVAAATIALASIMSAFIEPLWLRQRIKPAEVLLGVLIIPGVMLIARGTPHYMLFGLILGMLSALFVALVAILNKRFIHHSDAFTMTCIEMSAAWLFITVLSPVLPAGESAFVIPGLHDAILLLILALCCTALPFVLTFKAMRHVTAFGSLLAVNMEPVYTILLSIILLDEQRELGPRFYIGALIILIAVFTYPFMHRRTND